MVQTRLDVVSNAAVIPSAQKVRSPCSTGHCQFCSATLPLRLLLSLPHSSSPLPLPVSSPPCLALSSPKRNCGPAVHCLRTHQTFVPSIDLTKNHSFFASVLLTMLTILEALIQKCLHRKKSTNTEAYAELRLEGVDLSLLPSCRAVLLLIPRTLMHVNILAPLST